MPPILYSLVPHLKIEFLSPPADILPVEKLIQQIKQAWYACPTSLPELGRRYPKSRQRQNQARARSYLRLLNMELASRGEAKKETPILSSYSCLAPTDNAAWAAIQAHLRQATLSAATEILDLDAKDLEAIEAYGFIEAAADFAHRARIFDSDLGEAEIFQASRNVWSMNFMQVILGLPVAVTPSVFAYSLLYPYTDNFLDDPGVDLFAKARFSQRFALRLAGEPLLPESRTEAKICMLLEIIESQFERLRFPQVYASLQAIHAAQTRSLALLDKSLSPYEADLLGICFEKGGTSVLADGYLVAGDLTEVQQKFMFYYGALTQLVDDLEDVEHDLKSGVMTVFAQTARAWKLDTLTNRTFHFAGRALAAMQAIEAPGAEALLGLLRRSLNPLLVAQAGSVGRYFSPAYIKALEAYSPLPFGYLRRQRRDLERRGVSLVGLVEALAGEG